jgi:hypothetical protein
VETDFHKEPFLEKKEKELLAHKDNPPPDLKSKAPPVASARPSVKSAAPPAKVKKTVPVASNKKPLTKKPPTHQTTVSKQETASKKSSVLTPEQGTNTRDSMVKISAPSGNITNIPNVLKSRENILLKTLVVNHGNVEIRIYDDGAIDNDTVSVYYDNKLLISKARLSDLPITIKIPVEPSDKPHQLVMVAENLGDIPPNTSLLVVRDGEKRYEERIISNEQKNVVINFVYKKTE